MIEKIVGMLTGALAGYFLGMMIGFTAFDPNLDVWALLGALFGIVGLGVGLLPRFRRNTTLVLGALLGFYLSALLRVPLFGVEYEFDVLENGLGSLIVSLVGIGIGAWLGRRTHSAQTSLVLASALWGGFVGGLVLVTAANMDQEFTNMALAVTICGVVIGGIVWWGLRRFAPSPP